MEKVVSASGAVNALGRWMRTSAPAKSFHEKSAMRTPTATMPGRASGIETDQRAVGLATARDGKLYRLSFFTGLEAAQAAAAAD